jgi:hypothetical protein
MKNQGNDSLHVGKESQDTLPSPIDDIVEVRKITEPYEVRVPIWDMTPEQYEAESERIKRNMVKRKSTEV